MEAQNRAPAAYHIGSASDRTSSERPPPRFPNRRSPSADPTVIDLDPPDPRPRDLKFSSFPKRISKAERKTWICKVLTSLALDAPPGGWKLSYGTEVADVFVVLKLPDYDTALTIYRVLRGDPPNTTPSPLLTYQALHSQECAFQPQVVARTRRTEGGSYSVPWLGCSWNITHDVSKVFAFPPHGVAISHYPW